MSSLTERIGEIQNEKASAEEERARQIQLAQDLERARKGVANWKTRRANLEATTLTQEELDERVKETDHLLDIIGAKHQLEELRDGPWERCGQFEHYTTYQGDRRYPEHPGVFTSGVKLIFEYNDLDQRYYSSSGLGIGSGNFLSWRSGNNSGGSSTREDIVGWANIQANIRVVAGSETIEVKFETHNSDPIFKSISIDVPGPDSFTLFGDIDTNNSKKSYQTLRELLAQVCARVNKSPKQFKNEALERLKRNGLTTRHPVNHWHMPVTVEPYPASLNDVVTSINKANVRSGSGGLVMVPMRLFEAVETYVVYYRGNLDSDSFNSIESRLALLAQEQGIKQKVINELARALWIGDDEWVSLKLKQALAFGLIPPGKAQEFCDLFCGPGKFKITQ